MVERRPLVEVDGNMNEIPIGDTLPADIMPNGSGLPKFVLTNDGSFMRSLVDNGFFLQD